MMIKMVCVSLLECTLAQRSVRIAELMLGWNGNSADRNPMIGLVFYFVKVCTYPYLII